MIKLFARGVDKGYPHALFIHYDMGEAQARRTEFYVRSRAHTPMLGTVAI